MTRFVVYGAGAVGGTLGAELFDAGRDTVLIARGAHFDEIARVGLRLDTPEGSRFVPVPAVDHPAKLEFTGDDIVLLAMKSQDTQAALDVLRPLLPKHAAVCCVQNGVENERAALRVFENVYGTFVFCPATHVKPGLVIAPSHPLRGVLDIGRYPRGADERSKEIADAFSSSSFSALDVEEIMPWKYAKLLGNLSNAMQVVFGLDAGSGDISHLARAEGEACLKAARIDFVSDEAYQERSRGFVNIKAVPGLERHTTSSWQSIVRGSGSVECDYLNGEITLLGRMAGVPTPVNTFLQEIATEIAHGHGKPGEITPAEFLARMH